MNLKQLLRYKNKHVFKRYREDYPNSKLSAENAMEELLKYFWLSHKHLQELKKDPNNKGLKFACVMHREMFYIDDMWHTFLLFTADYHDFCQKYFGNFIHHSPNTSEKRPSGKRYETELTRYLSYVYDNLGEETLKTWFASLL